MMAIPKQAQPIADYIRERTIRPSMEQIVSGYCNLRIGAAQCCPMGLLEIATHPRPFERHHFRWLPSGFTKKSIRAFGKWWDSQTDPQSAMNAIWPANPIRG